MAVNIQLRRGVANEWTTSNPILTEGEIGVETDTKKLKVGDGLTTWSSLPYITLTPAAAATLYAPLANPTFTGTVAGVTKTHVGLGNVDNTSDANKPVSTATQTALDLKASLASPTFTGTVSLDTGVTLVFEGATANAFETTLGATDPTADRTLTLPDVTGTLATQDYVANEIGSHSGDTTSVHGISDTSELATKTYADTAVSTHSSDTTAVHGITDTSALTTASNTQTLTNKTLTSPKINEDVAVTATATELNYVDGVTSAIQTQLDAKAPLANPTFTGTVSGITKAMVGLGNVDDTADTAKPVSTAQATAIATAKSEAIADATSQVNALLTGAPAALNTLDELAAALGDDANFATTVTTALGNKAPLADPTFTGTVTLPAGGIVFSDGTQAKEGIPSRTPIVSKTASYTLSVLTHRDSLIEVDSSSATTISIPTDATLNYPVGTSIDILQINTGQVTIAAVTPGTTTVNSTPGLKLRTRWSSCTLFKRAANTWVVFGDLTA